MKLHIGDEYKRIVDVMNNCFGWNYKACYKGWYQLNKDKNSSAWFPKMAVLDNGKPQPGDKWYGWCNTFSPDKKYIYMNNFEDPSLLNKELSDELHVTFAKMPGEDYKYEGVYVRTKRDLELGWIYEKVADDIDTKDYI